MIEAQISNFAPEEEISEIKGKKLSNLFFRETLCAYQEEIFCSQRIAGLKQGTNLELLDFQGTPSVFSFSLCSTQSAEDSVSNQL